MKFTMGGCTSRLDRMASLAREMGAPHNIIWEATRIIDEYDCECRDYGTLSITVPRRIYDACDYDGAWDFFGYDGFSEDDDNVTRVFMEWDWQHWEGRYAPHVRMKYERKDSICPFPTIMMIDTITIERAFPLIRMLHDRLGIEGVLFTPYGESTKGVLYRDVCRWEEKYAWAVKELARIRRGL